ncbi:hypothetical protein EIP91_009099 [Steccherinum ochraceum]|uniref:MYND-type domain-containing protein n=1 Tax=Steccherinum ochraceum TaxID=92696 RepID=A0A4R0RN11_9APHY|nr:hypothetical protein EIP91_009099 [Steccherinum ochraceum]
MCDISRKFLQSSRDVPDLEEADFKARKKVVNAVNKWAGSKGRTDHGPKWIPILYEYEIVTGSNLNRLKDRGNVVFIDLTTTRLLLVMCFGDIRSSCQHHASFQSDYAAITEANAHRLFSLVKYLFHNGAHPVSVRATYTTHQHGLHPDFLGSDDPPSHSNVPIFHITPHNFIPSLQTGEIQRIDSVLTMFKETIPAKRVKKTVTGNSVRPTMATLALGEMRLQDTCAECGAGDVQRMRECSKCKLVRYCSAACQKKAWPRHKRVCLARVNSSSEGDVNPAMASTSTQDGVNQPHTHTPTHALMLLPAPQSPVPRGLSNRAAIFAIVALLASFLFFYLRPVFESTQSG